MGCAFLQLGIIQTMCSQLERIFFMEIFQHVGHNTLACFLMHGFGLLPFLLVAKWTQHISNTTHYHSEWLCFRLSFKLTLGFSYLNSALCIHHLKITPLELPNRSCFLSILFSTDPHNSALDFASFSVPLQNAAYLVPKNSKGSILVMIN